MFFILWMKKLENLKTSYTQINRKIILYKEKKIVGPKGVDICRELRGLSEMRS